MANSAKPILVAGAIGGVALLGVAWMYAASSGAWAERDAVIRAEALNAKYPALMPESTEPAAEETETAKAEPEPEAMAEAEEPKTAEAEQAETDEPAEAEQAEAETETKVAEAETAEPEQPQAEAEEPKPAETESEEKVEAETESAQPEEVEAKAEETQVAAAAGTAEEKPAEEPPAEAEKPEETETASLTGDPEKGKKVFKKCKACHMVGDDAKNRVGPILNGIVGDPKGAADGFKYSDVFMKANEAGETWTPEELDVFLTKPRAAMKGTKMAFAGLRKADQRADVIAYLASFE